VQLTTLPPTHESAIIEVMARLLRVFGNACFKHHFAADAYYTVLLGFLLVLCGLSSSHFVKPAVGLEPTTYGLQNRGSTN
jgi:hypothetical protein